MTGLGIEQTSHVYVVTASSAMVQTRSGADEVLRTVFPPIPLSISAHSAVHERRPAMPTRVAINGFGRIGRQAFKIASSKPDLEIVAINDIGDVANMAYLLKHDTVYRSDSE